MKPSDVGTGETLLEYDYARVGEKAREEIDSGTRWGTAGTHRFKVYRIYQECIYSKLYAPPSG